MDPAVTPPKSDAILARLLRLHPKLIDLSLGRMHRLLAALDHPERRLPPVVHVTGTNGKGSVLAFLRAILEAAGYRVHVYTSPHLVRFHERIRLDGTLIDEAHLSDALERCENANGEEPITFFEITTAAAFLAFNDVPADIVLLENGLGGRLDATNVIDKPAATGITPVDMDHQQFLGDTLADIAFEKAGIIKSGVPCVLGPQQPAALDVIKKRAATLGAPVLAHGTDWSVSETADGITLRYAGTDLPLPRPNLPGVHQIGNAGHAAMLALTLTDFQISEADAAAGLSSAEWPARLQRLMNGPVVDALGPAWDVWLDGGHNPAAGAALAAFIARQWTDRPLHLIAGMIDTKDPVGYFRPLAAYAVDARCVTIPDEKASISGKDLTAMAVEAGVAAHAVQSALAAAAEIAAAHPDGGRVLLCGSLYFAGHVLADHG